MTSKTPSDNKKIEVLENLINEFQNRSDQSDRMFQDAMEKMAKVEANLQKALERREKADLRVNELESDLKAAASCLKQAEKHKSACAKKEKEQQDEILTLQENITDLEVRAENAEESVGKLERLTDGIQTEYDSVHTLREAVEDEQEKACQEN